MLGEVRVSQFFTPGQVLAAVRPHDSLETILSQLDDSQYLVLPVVDGQNRLLGVVDLEEVHLVTSLLMSGPWLSRKKSLTCDRRHAIDAGRESWTSASELFIEHDLSLVARR